MPAAVIWPRDDGERRSLLVNGRGETANVMGAPRISVIVPTYQRGSVVTELIAALCRQNYEDSFEVVVVIDGSTDDTEQRVAAMRTPFPMHVIWQPNGGLANARNRGAAAAKGEILMFLDDDMEPDPDLLAEHDRLQRDNADIVAGAIPLHADSPRTLLAEGVAAWAEARTQRLAGAGYEPRFNEIVSGQVSIKREVFERLGGFDERFTAGGSYGNEDLDFGYRLLRAGYRAVFNPRAVSRQRYVVTAAAYLRQYEDAGRADVVLARKYPELLPEIFHGELAASRLHRLVRRPVLCFPRFARWVIGAVLAPIVRRVDAGSRGPLTVRALFLARAVHYWAGVHYAGGIPRHRKLRVLCYHAVADLGHDPVMGEYGVPPERFRSQLETLHDAGYQFVHPDEVVRFVDGDAGLPRRALLLTFDDCYRDTLTAAAPLARGLNVPSVAFAVSARLGQTNDWDRWLGASALQLLPASDLLALTALGVEIGGHSRTHPYLPTLSGNALEDEIRGCARDLCTLGLPCPRFFSYPHGEHDLRTQAAVRAAGFVAAFTTSPGRIGRRTDRYALPRVEILPRDIGWRLRMKVAAAGVPLRSFQFAHRIIASVNRRFRAMLAMSGKHRNEATRG